jgi:hypothetical protein
MDLEVHDNCFAEATSMMHWVHVLFIFLTDSKENEGN